MDRPLIRAVRGDDAGPISAVYAPYVTDTATSLEEVPPTAEEMAGRIADKPLWLVAEDEGGGLLGYAYAGHFHPRPAYRWTVETTIYLAPDRRRAGIGRTLYGALLDRLAAAGFTSAVAMATLPNDETARFHEAMGFVEAGRVANVAWKLGRWWDVGYWQRDLADRRDPPAEPRRV